MKRFNSRLFIVLSILMVALTFFSFMSAFARDEGTLGHSRLRGLFADLFNVLRFPTHALLPGITKDPLYFSLGLLINCLLYSFIVERIFSLVFMGRAAREARE